eukprot:12522792-Alexandrium_andersonii.AAC.1
MGSNKWVSTLPAVSCASPARTPRCSPGGATAPRAHPKSASGAGEAQETAGRTDTHLLLPIWPWLKGHVRARADRRLQGSRQEVGHQGEVDHDEKARPPPQIFGGEGSAGCPYKPERSGVFSRKRQSKGF